MNPYVKRGLEIMRDPRTVQAGGTLRDATGAMCAMGCVVQAAVEDGAAQWICVDGYYYVIAPGQEVNESISVGSLPLPACVRDAYSDIKNHGMWILDITTMNDTLGLSLPEIAERIESVYSSEPA